MSLKCYQVKHRKQNTEIPYLSIKLETWSSHSEINRILHIAGGRLLMEPSRGQFGFKIV